MALPDEEISDDGIEFQFEDWMSENVESETEGVSSGGSSLPVPLVGGDPSTYYFARRSEIAGNRDNYRLTLPDIPPLAASILQHGLLENLVGIQIPPFERQSPEQWIQVKAGSRRLAAIDLLIQNGQWDPQRLIAVLLIDSDGFWPSLVENIQRTDAQPWEIGRRLAEACKGGMANQEIARRVGRSKGYVSKYIRIGTGLAPEFIAYITTRKLKVTEADLYRIAFLQDRFGDPDAEKQIAALQRSRNRKKRIQRTPSAVASFASRIFYMRSNMPVPGLLRPVVEAVLEYLENGKPPNFRALQDHLIGERVRLFGDDPEPDTGETP